MFGVVRGFRHSNINGVLGTVKHPRTVFDAYLKTLDDRSREDIVRTRRKNAEEEINDFLTYYERSERMDKAVELLESNGYKVTKP